MKITVFNDTEGDWLIHSGSVLGSKGECRIPSCHSVEFEGPDRSDPFIKVWNATRHHSAVVMVRFRSRVADGGLQFASRPYVDPKTGLSNV